MSRHPTPQATRRKPSPRFALRPTAVAVHLLLAGVAVGGWVGAAQAQTPAAAAASARSYNIPAGPLNAVLTRFLGESGVLLSGSSELAQGKQSPGVQGNLTPEAGLAALLAGTGLQAVADAQGRYVLRVAPVVTRSGEAQLATVTVTANQSSPVGPDYGYVAKRSRGATRTDTPLIETPQAISVVTREQFRDRAAVNMTDALRDVAGATVTQGGFRDRDDYSLRGFTQSNFVLRDGLRQYTFQFIASEPWGLERIEVLKGPSSVLYGQLALGGTVNLVSKRPTGETIREVEVGVGTNDAKRLAFDLGGKVGDESDWSWRLNGLTSASKDDIDFIDRKRTYIAPAFKWQPSQSTTLTLLGLYQESTSGRPQGLPARGTVLPNINGSIPYTRSISEPNFGEQTFKQSQLGYLFEHQFANGVEFRQNLRVSNNKIDGDNLFSGGLQADQRHLNRRVSVFDQEVDTIAIDSHLQKRVVPIAVVFPLRICHVSQRRQTRLPVGGSYSVRHFAHFTNTLPQVLPVRLVRQGEVTEVVAR